MLLKHILKAVLLINIVIIFIDISIVKLFISYGKCECFSAKKWPVEFMQFPKL